MKKYKVADDAKPQIYLLLIATVITLALWFIPYADYLVYPIRLFVTFVHEGSHVIAALLTGGSVESLTVSPDASGLVMFKYDSTISQLITSSAGYLGSTAFGVLLLVLIRRAYSARIVLAASAIFVGAMTLLFGLFAPIWNVSTVNVSFGSVLFTVTSGAILTVGLLAIARYASARVAQFTMTFLAVQCVLNALSDLKTVFYASSPFANPMQTDALNMANATGLPSVAWVLIWIAISVLMISVGLRVYVARQKGNQYDLPFED